MSFEASIHSADQQIIRSAELFAKKGCSVVICTVDGDFFFQCAHLEHVYVAAQGRGQYAGGLQEPCVIYPYKAMRDLGVVVSNRNRPAYEGPLRCALLMTIAGTDWAKHGFPGLGLETGWGLLRNPAIYSPSQVRAASSAPPAVRRMHAPVGGRLGLASA